MGIQPVPNRHQDSAAHRQVMAERINQIRDFTFDDSRVRTQAEIAAGVTPVNYAYPPGDLRRYGVDLTGATDSATAFANALLSNDRVFVPGGSTIKSTVQQIMRSGMTIYGEGPTSLLVFTDGDSNGLVGNGITNTIVRDLKIQITGAGSSSIVAPVHFATSTFCHAERLEVIGHSWAGVLVNESDHCVVRFCYFHATQGTVQDAADVAIYRTSNYNTVEGNECYGGGWHGIMVQDPGSSHIPTRNIVNANHIGPHTAYGILRYNIDNADTYDVLSNNQIDGITGVNPSSGGGMGIYVAGCGGVTIVGNSIRNCCISTTSDSLGPAGITVNNSTGLAPVTIVGNAIIDMVNKDGIAISGTDTPVTISGNTIRFAAGLSARYGIYVNSVSNVNVVGNNIDIASSISGTEGIFVFAVADVRGIVVSGNVINGTSNSGIRFDQSGGHTTAHYAITGNIVRGGSSASIGLRITSAILGTISGNTAITTTVAALQVNACTQLRIANNVLTSTGTSAVVTTGTCTGSYFDKSNHWNGTLVNGATGLICEQLAAAVPSTGTAAVGDRAEMSVPAVGSPKGWRCTVAGAAGTWVSEGNL